MSNQKLYVITALFNPFASTRRITLYHHFAEHLKESGAVLVTIELAYGDRAFEVTQPNTRFQYQLRTSQILWHKERLINVARQFLKHDEPDAKYIGWFDCDLTFADPDWVADSIHALQLFKIIQPFSFAVNLNLHEEYMWHCPSTLYAYKTGLGYHQKPPLPLSYIYKGHPGLAWCARSETLDAIGGLFDLCIAGSADTIMANVWKGDFTQYLPGTPSAGLIKSMAKYQQRSDVIVRGDLGYSRGTVLHHWHGASESRGYEKRWEITSFHQFDPESDVELDAHGLHRWVGNKPQLEQDILLSLSARDEDATH